MDGLIRIKGATFPVTTNPPAGRFYIGIDVSDGHLKKQDSAGVVIDYDSGAAYTDEMAQDAIGNALQPTSSVNLIYNDAAGTFSAQVNPAGVNHNLLQNYQADEHIPHTSVTIATPAAGGLTGGGNIAANRTLSLAINGMTEKSILEPGDEVAVFSPGNSAHRKMKAYRFQKTNPDRYTFHHSDFVNSALGELTSAISGTGASAQTGTYGADAGTGLTEQAQGVVEVDTGTTATGRSALGTASVTALWNASGNILRFAARLATNTLSAGTETFIMFAGFLDNLGAAGDAADGAYFRYTDAVNGGRWECVVAAGGVRQAFDSGVVATISYQVFEVVIDYTAVNPVVMFMIDGALVQTINFPAPIPIGPTQAFGYGWKIEKTVGTSQRNMYADWYSFELDRNAAR